MKKLLNYKLPVCFLIIFSPVILFQGCCKCDDPSNPECPNYDPCYEVESPIADFGAGYEYFIPGEEDYNNFYRDTTIYLDGDTIPGTCTFYAYTEDVDSFYWKVGQDPRIFRGESFYLEFDDEFHMQPINVQLTVMKMSECFEGGFVRDTLEKILVPDTKYVESPSWTMFRSKYWGVSTEFPTDSFEIEMKDDIEWIVNLPRGTNGNTALYRRDFDEVFFSGQSNKTIWMGNAKFQPENRRKIVIHYKVSYDLGETANWYTYTGYRVD